MLPERITPLIKLLLNGFDALFKLLPQVIHWDHFLLFRPCLELPGLELGTIEFGGMSELVFVQREVELGEGDVGNGWHRHSKSWWYSKSTFELEWD